MHLWILNGFAQPPATQPWPQREPIDRALAGIIGCIGRRDFGSAALSSLNAAVALDSWSIYRVFPGRPPCLHASGSYRVDDTTADCFRVYLDGLYRADASFDDARACAASAGPLMTHVHADELPAAHRDKIYAQHGMRERISLIVPDGSADDGLMAVNLYRHLHQRPFERDDFVTLRAAAPLLLSCVERHVQIAPAGAGAAVRQPAAPAAVAGIESLQQRCPALTARELQICERILRGWTHDGIAADLGLSVATVKTYRNRAFDRLGIHFRSELFNLSMALEPAR